MELAARGLAFRTPSSPCWSFSWLLWSSLIRTAFPFLTTRWGLGGFLLLIPSLVRPPWTLCPPGSRTSILA